MRYVATVHVYLDVEADTEIQARDIVRARVAEAGMRLSSIGPGHAVSGVRLDLPLSERVRADRLAERLGGEITEYGVERIAERLGVRPYGRAHGGVAIYARPDAEKITRYVQQVREG